MDVLSYPHKYPNKTLLPPYIRSDYLRSLARIFHELKSIGLQKLVMLYVDPFANRPCKAAYRLSERLQVYQNKRVNSILIN